jgi:hypothetical protein
MSCDTFAPKDDPTNLEEEQEFVRAIKKNLLNSDCVGGDTCVYFCALDILDTECLLCVSSQSNCTQEKECLTCLGAGIDLQDQANCARNINNIDDSGGYTTVGIIIAVAVVVIIAITLGSIYGLKNKMK